VRLGEQVIEQGGFARAQIPGQDGHWNRFFRSHEGTAYPIPCGWQMGRTEKDLTADERRLTQMGKNDFARQVRREWNEGDGTKEDLLASLAPAPPVVRDAGGTRPYRGLG
jgi:hypothetical protein